MVLCKAPTGSLLGFIYSQEFNYIYIHIQFDNQNAVLSILTIYCFNCAGSKDDHNI